jgi:hypothetical protein
VIALAVCSGAGCVASSEEEAPATTEVVGADDDDVATEEQALNLGEYSASTVGRSKYKKFKINTRLVTYGYNTFKGTLALEVGAYNCARGATCDVAATFDIYVDDVGPGMREVYFKGPMIGKVGPDLGRARISDGRLIEGETFYMTPLGKDVVKSFALALKNTRGSRATFNSFSDCPHKVLWPAEAAVNFLGVCVGVTGLPYARSRTCGLPWQAAIGAAMDTITSPPASCAFYR